MGLSNLDSDQSIILIGLIRINWLIDSRRQLVNNQDCSSYYYERLRVRNCVHEFLKKRIHRPGAEPKSLTSGDDYEICMNDRKK
jgi:hypothetical protein